MCSAVVIHHYTHNNVGNSDDDLADEEGGRVLARIPHFRDDREEGWCSSVGECKR